MSKETNTFTRRSLLQSAPAALLMPAAGWAQSSSSGPAPSGPAHAPIALPVLTQPAQVFAYIGEAEPERHALSRSGSEWTPVSRAAALAVNFAAGPAEAVLSVDSSAPIQRIHLRWQHPLPAETLALGDAWERSYGDLAWRPLEAERVLPWYAVLHAHGRTAGMGVKTGAASFAFWQADARGISLWLDLRNGGNGVALGSRRLEAATVVACMGEPDESAFAVAKRLCRVMAQGSAVPARRGQKPVDTIYGSNDWYYAYGQNTADNILRDADWMASLAPSGPIRPYTVIDDGYQDASRFPSLARLASSIRERNVIPGLWIRPLRAAATTPANLRLPDARWDGPCNDQPPLAYDPTIPEALEAVAAVAAEACAWGYELIKHDFTTFELFGQWGSQMGASPTRGNWHFNNRALTNAEIVTALYRRLRTACGEDRVILGCNTVGHLSVGIFDASRTGDDVSGRQWERTRRTGVNTLAFRLPQHKTFFALDADCVAITPDVPWPMTRQWLEAVAASGSVLLVSPDPKSTGPDQKQAVQEAFARCLAHSRSEPLDWISSRTPARWRTQGGERSYEWTPVEGGSPFPIGIQRGAE